LSPRDDQCWEQVLSSYSFASDAEANAVRGNPVDNLKPLAAAGVPLLHVFGDLDLTVPFEQNTQVVADRYEVLGGVVKLIRKEGVGHHPHGLDDCTPIVSFILEHSSTVPVGLLGGVGAKL